jgi:hypothetical protein
VIPTRDELRATLAGFDERQKKIVGALLAVMFQNPGRVREREWIVEQLTHVTLLAGQFEQVESVQEGVQTVQAYLHEHLNPLLNACYGLFQRVAEDLEQRTPPPASQDAMVQALTYF